MKTMNKLILCILSLFFSNLVFAQDLLLPIDDRFHVTFLLWFAVIVLAIFIIWKKHRN